MHRLTVVRVARAIADTRRAPAVVVIAMFAFLAAGVQAAEGPFGGISLAFSRPANNNYRAHVHDGVAVNPYAGYMFNKYLGAEGQLHFVFQAPDNDHRGFEKENQTTTLFGGTVGPRVTLPWGGSGEVWATTQGGIFTGLSGRLTQTAPGLTAGGGFDYYLTPDLALGAFGAWNRAYMAPRPTHLSNLVASQQGPEDIKWVTAGIRLNLRFNAPAAPAK